MRQLTSSSIAKIKSGLESIMWDECTIDATTGISCGFTQLGGNRNYKDQYASFSTDGMFRLALGTTIDISSTITLTKKLGSSVSIPFKVTNISVGLCEMLVKGERIQT